jgi:hypothetical protein
MHTTPRAKQTHRAVLKQLCSPYLGTPPKRDKDAFYSSLFCYRVFDIFAYHHGIGQRTPHKKRSTVPYTTHLVGFLA